MANLSFELKGSEELKRKLRGMGPAMIRVAARSLYRSAEAVMSDSKEHYVPVDTGTLRSTGRVDPPETSSRNVKVILGFGGPSAPYALAVHENPRSGKTGGQSPSGRPYKHYAQTGQWKYLQTPIEQALPDIARQLKLDLDRVPETL